MKPERWQQIKSLLQSTFEREPTERPAFLDEACEGDELLRQQVDSLIISHEQAVGFLEEPAFELMAESLESNRAELVEVAGRKMGGPKEVNKAGMGPGQSRFSTTLVDPLYP